MASLGSLISTAWDRVTKASSPPPIPSTALTIAGAQEQVRIQPMQELGATGLLRTRGTGIIYEEWLSNLSSYRQRQVYREMRDNDPTIGSMFFAVEMILRRAEWSVEPAGTDPESERIAQFIRDAMDDMSHTWQDFICECVSMFAFGFSLFETVYKRRMGPQKTKPSSKFSDGLIGWRKMAPRALESILYWDWDDGGGLQGAVQLAAPNYITTLIPIEKLLLFRTTSLKGNPEGRSLLRNCFVPWTYKKRLQEVEGIGIERDICGMPVLYATREALINWGGGNFDAGFALAKKLVTNIRVDDQQGVVLPQAFDEKGNKQVELCLMKSGGSKQSKPSEAIGRYNTDILQTMLAGFIQFGSTEHGSRSLHVSATQIFIQAIGANLDSMAGVMNRVAVPRLMALNGMDLAKAPRFVPGEIEVRDLEETANFILKLSQAGITFADPDTAAFLRRMAKLPEQPAGDDLPLDDPDADTDDAPPTSKPPVKRKPTQAQGNPADEGSRLESAV